MLLCFGFSIFYDTELNSICLNNVKDSVKELFNPLNCFRVDGKMNENEDPTIFVNFSEPDLRYYTLLIRGSSQKYRKYSKIITKDNCKEILEEIVKKIEQEFSISKFNIYFTVNLRNIDSDFFKMEKRIESVDLIRKTFKELLTEETVVKYIPKVIYCILYISGKALQRLI